MWHLLLSIGHVHKAKAARDGVLAEATTGRASPGDSPKRGVDREAWERESGDSPWDFLSVVCALPRATWADTLHMLLGLLPIVLECPDLLPKEPYL